MEIEALTVGIRAIVVTPAVKPGVLVGAVG
jgi:hypothetical protein